MTSDDTLIKARGAPAPPASDPGAATTGTAIRLRAIQYRTGDEDLAALADEVAAIEDRLLYAEAAVAHLCDYLGIGAHELPDPLRPRLHVPAADEIGVPE